MAEVHDTLLHDAILYHRCPSQAQDRVRSGVGATQCDARCRDPPLTPSGLDAVFDLIEEVGQSHRLAVALDEFQDIRAIYEILVKPLTNNQLKVLRGLASVGGAQPQSKAFLAASGVRLPASVKRALDRLVKSEIVYGSESDYKFFDPFFRQWILRDL
jgi:hypothetical protein